MSTSTPPAKRQVPLWVAVLPFLVTAVAVVAVQQWRRPAPPRDLTELAERIKAKHPEWRIVASSETGDLAAGFWICRQDRSKEVLTHLRRDLQQESAWQGVLHVNRRSDYIPPVKEWQHMGLVMDGVFVFGDAQMLEELAAMI